MPRTVNTMTHWGAYKVTAYGSCIEAVTPWPGDPDPSPIGQSLADIAIDRVMRPTIRRGWLEGTGGRRGADEMVPVPWDEALDLAAEALRRVYDEHGPGAVYGGSYGWSSAGRFHHAQSQVHRFLGALGGYVGSRDTYSHAAAEVITPHILGYGFETIQGATTSLSVVAEATDLVVAFGGIPAKNAQIQHSGQGPHVVVPWLRVAADRGCRFVNLSPLQDDLPADLSAEWLPLRPGSDTAVMLACLYVLETDGLADRDFLDRYTSGWPTLRAYLLGETDGVAKTPHWAAGLSGLAAETIADLARDMAGKRTMINVAWSLQRADHGEQPIWAAIALAAALGQIGLPGGGFAIGYGTVGSIGNGSKRIPAPRLPQFPGSVVDFIPVARIADMLLNPGRSYHYNTEIRTYPDIRLVYWAGGNPYHHHQDLARLAEAWQRPETIIVNEPFWTATARMADIVFPATTPLERRDIGGASADRLLVSMEPAIPPVGESRDDYTIFSALADRLQVGDRFAEGLDAEGWQRRIYDRFRHDAPDAPDYDGFRDKGFHDHGEEPETQRRILLDRFRRDPNAAPLPTPTGRIVLASDRLAALGDPEIPAHPTWKPPTEWLGAPAAADYPFHLLSHQPATRLHSQLDRGRISQAAKVAGREALLINPQDADALGIVDGDAVVLTSPRGSTEAGARVTDGLRPGVVVLPTGAWWAPTDAADPGSRDRAGNPNVLTRDEGCSPLSQGPSAQSCLVRIERLAAADG